MVGPPFWPRSATPALGPTTMQQGEYYQPSKNSTTPHPIPKLTPLIPPHHTPSDFHSDIDSQSTRNVLTLPISKLFALDRGRSPTDTATAIRIRFVVENKSTGGTGSRLSYNLQFFRLWSENYLSGSSTAAMTNPEASNPSAPLALSQGHPLISALVLTINGASTTKRYQVFSFTVPANIDYTVSMSTITGSNYGLKFLVQDAGSVLPTLSSTTQCFSSSVTCSQNKPSASYLRINREEGTTRNYNLLVYSTTSTATPLVFSILATPSTTQAPTHLLGGVTLLDIGMREDRNNFFEVSGECRKEMPHCNSINPTNTLLILSSLVAHTRSFTFQRTAQNSPSLSRRFLPAPTPLFTFQKTASTMARTGVTPSGLRITVAMLSRQSE